MKEIKKVLLIAVGVALFLPFATVVAFEAGPYGPAFVTAVFVGAFLLVIYSGMNDGSDGNGDVESETDAGGEA